MKEAKLHLDNGKTLTIKAENQSVENVYVKRVTLNGKELENNTITHKEIMGGGELIFEMSNSYE